MPGKKVNVLSQFFCVFKSKKPAERDIVSMADKIIEDYIFSKNKLIRRKEKKNPGTNILIVAGLIAAGTILLILNII